MLIELIICDLVPLRERSKFLGIILGTFTVGTAIGPFLGGVVAQSTDWRVSLFPLLLPFLQVHYTKESTLSKKLEHIDWIGNLVLIPSLINILIALTDADTKAPWSSFQILVPLILGFLGLISFQLYESSLCAEPTISTRLFSNRTSVTAYLNTLLHTITSI